MTDANPSDVPHPYRAAEPHAGRRVLARRGRAATAWRLALALAGLATPIPVVLWLDRVPALFVLMLMGVPLGLLELGRTVHARFVSHVIEIDDAGLHFAWGTRVLAMPWLARHDRELTWSSLRAVRVHTTSVNGWSSTTLVITTEGETFEVPDDRFDRSADLIQRDILDFVERTRERPTPGEAAARMRERFPTRELRVRPPWPPIGACAFFVPFIGFPVWLASESPGTVTRLFAAFAVLVFGWCIVIAWSSWWSARVLCLGPEGLAIGPSEARARLVRWDEIQLVRREITNGKLEALDIVEHDGTHTAVRHHYGYGFEVLARMLDPHA